MAEEGSVINLTLGKIEEGRLFSLTPLTLFSLFHSHLTSLSLSLSLLQINIFYSYTLSLLINSIELIWTSPFQNNSLNLSLFSPGHVSHLSFSRIHLWLNLMCHMTWAFFLSLFSIASWAFECDDESEWVSEWELIIEP